MPCKYTDEELQKMIEQTEFYQELLKDFREFYGDDFIPPTKDDRKDKE